MEPFLIRLLYSKILIPHIWWETRKVLERIFVSWLS